MKKVIYISILCTVMLTACGNTAKTAESAVSQNTTTVTTAAETSAKEEKHTSEATTITKKSSQTVSETSIEKATTKSRVSSSAVSTHTPQEQTKPQSYSQTEQPQESIQTITTQRSVVTTQRKQTAAKQTTTATPKPATTTQKPQTTSKPVSTVTWSQSMKAWRKLCEGKSLSGQEQELIRSEILEYAQIFNGKKDIRVSFGIDEYDISYEKPLNLTIRNDMTDLSYAHMDAYADADSRWLIDYAKNEEEIYDIVSETREDCLHVIDYGLFNRWEIYSGNNALKYASEIEFNVGFDGTTIWFLTED